MTPPRSFVWLGASDYALRLLQAVLSQRPNDRLDYLVDVGADRRREAIAKRLLGHISPQRILDTAVLKEPSFLARLAEARPDVAISAHFGEILADDFLAIPRHGVVNVHSAHLPHNRGHWPEIWSIIRGTPAGMTLHYIGKGIDTGDIVAQREVPVALEDTCESLASKIEVVGIELLTNAWDDIVDGRVVRTPQSQKLSLNLARHLHDIAEINLDATYTGAELLNRLRALTIPRLLEGAFFVDPSNGDRIHVQVKMTRVSNEGIKS